MLFKRSFSIIELITVMVVVGILAAFAVPIYRNAQLRTFDREAEINLKLIQAAEKTYRIEERSYVSTANTTDTNALLDLDISIGGHWGYSVPLVDNTPAAPNPPTFCAEATSGNESWHINQDDPEAVDCDCTLSAGSCTNR